MPKAKMMFSTWGLLFVFLFSPLHSWAEENPELQGLVDELRELSEKARDQRAADRWLQQALEDLVAKYDWPWRKELLSESFSDGDFTKDPEWTVLSGKFWVDASLGLRSRVEQKKPSRSEETSQSRTSDSENDLGRALIGALLNEALKKERGESEKEPQQKEEATRPDDPARIRVASEISNAFLINMTFSIHNAPSEEGHFEIRLLQDQYGDFGYVLAIQSGRGGMLDLYRLRRGKAELVYGSRLKEDPGDGKRHELIWRQAENGQVDVILDDEKTMNLEDRAFRDGYGWLELANLSGELGVRKLEIFGTP